jgi:hypothetical protein
MCLIRQHDDVRACADRLFLCLELLDRRKNHAARRAVQSPGEILAVLRLFGRLAQERASSGEGIEKLTNTMRISNAWRTLPPELQIERRN